MRRALLAFAVVCAAIAPPTVVYAQRTEASRDQLTLPAPKPGHAKPLVVVVADSGGAETTDFVIPYGVLKESDAADVRTVSTRPGPLQLMLQLRVQPDETTTQFDAETPEGADIVIVPAQMQPKSPLLIAWLQNQAAHGATIISICEGARVLAAAGLLHGKRATSHFSSLQELEHNYPDAIWVRDRRYVQDGRIISTTGVSASIPVSLALVEAIGGREVAQTTARRLGVTDWSSAHRTADFRITAGDYANGLYNFAAFWNHETLEAPLEDGMDEIQLALRTDAWGRSFRTKIVTTHPEGTAVHSRNGLVIIPDAPPQRGAHLLPTADGPGAAVQLGQTFAAMHRRYGAGAERLARLGMEYDQPTSVGQ